MNGISASFAGVVVAPDRLHVRLIFIAADDTRFYVEIPLEGSAESAAAAVEALTSLQQIADRASTNH